MIIIKNKQRVIIKDNHNQVHRSFNLQVHGASKILTFMENEWSLQSKT